MLPGKPVYIDGVSYWVPDLSKLRTTIANTLDVPMSTSIRNSMERDALEYEESIPTNAVELNAEETKRLNRQENEDEVKTRKKAKNPSTDSRLLKDPYEQEDSIPDSVPSKKPSSSGRSPAPSPGIPSAGKTAQ